MPTAHRPLSTPHSHSSSLQGRIVSRQSIPVIAGFSSILMNVSNLSAGTYSIQAIFADEKTKLVRFVKQ